MRRGKEHPRHGHRAIEYERRQRLRPSSINSRIDSPPRLWVAWKSFRSAIAARIALASPDRKRISLRCKAHITLCQVKYTYCYSRAALCVAPQPNSAAIGPSSRLASPAPRRSRCSRGFSVKLGGHGFSSRGVATGVAMTVIHGLLSKGTNRVKSRKRRPLPGLAGGPARATHPPAESAPRRFTESPIRWAYHSPMKVMGKKLAKCHPKAKPSAGAPTTP